MYVRHNVSLELSFKNNSEMVYVNIQSGQVRSAREIQVVYLVSWHPALHSLASAGVGCTCHICTCDGEEDQWIPLEVTRLTTQSQQCSPA